MPPRNIWNTVYPSWEAQPFNLPDAAPSEASPSTSPSQNSLPLSALHLLQPPSAPRLRNIPLPDPVRGHRRPRAPPSRRNVFPIDLTNDLDFNELASRIEDYIIPPHTAIDIIPTSRDCILLQLDSGDRQTSSVSIIRRLQRLMRAALSLGVFAGLPSDASESVRSHFLSVSGPSGPLLWQEFLNGSPRSDGPRGAVLLRGHCHIWGFSPDYQGKLVVTVAAPLPLF